jgi:hypothetical protein
MTPAQRADARDQLPPLTDAALSAAETEPLDTTPLVPLDTQYEEIRAFGKRLDAGRNDANGDDDE